MNIGYKLRYRNWRFRLAGRGVASCILCVAGLFMPLLAGALLAAGASGVFETWPSARTGIAWRHDSARSPRRYQPESIGPASRCSTTTATAAWTSIFQITVPPISSSPQNRSAPPLYRNDGNGRFTDVAAAAGVSDPGFFGLGAAAADYDNDGWVEIESPGPKGRIRRMENVTAGRYYKLPQQ